MTDAKSNDAQTLRKAASRVVSQHRGPVSFTAPHGISVRREGCKQHAAESGTTELAIRLCEFFQKRGSSVIWNRKTSRPAEAGNLDPNFLRREQFTVSPWHMALEKHAKTFVRTPLRNPNASPIDVDKALLIKDGPNDSKQEIAASANSAAVTTKLVKPIAAKSSKLAAASKPPVFLTTPFHVDLHGKKNRPGCAKQIVDIGMRPMKVSRVAEHTINSGVQELWCDQKFVVELRDALHSELTAAIGTFASRSNVEFNTSEGDKYVVNKAPYLDAWWCVT